MLSLKNLRRKKKCNMSNIEMLAADTLLERGLPLPVRATLFFRLLGFKTLVCYQPSLGNKIRINRLYLKMGLTPEMLNKITLQEADLLMIKHGNKLCQIIAIGLFKGWISPMLFSYIAGIKLKWRLSPQRICTIAHVMITQSGSSDFMDTTRCIERMTILKPVQLGQTPKKS